MNNYRVWLNWWLMFVLSSLGFVIYYVSGLFWNVHNADITYICHIISVVFFYFSIRVGWNTYHACKDSNYNKYYHYNDMGWFAANHLPTLGLLGTLIGMSYVFIFSGLDMSTKVGQALAIKGMGTALYTTITGTICSILLKKQLFNLKYFLDEKTDKTNGI